MAYEDTVFYSTGRFSVSIDEVEHYDNGEAYSEYNSDPGTEYGESNNYASNYGGDYQKPSVDYRVTLVIIGAFMIRKHTEKQHADPIWLIYGLMLGRRHRRWPSIKETLVINIIIMSFIMFMRKNTPANKIS